MSVLRCKTRGCPEAVEYEPKPVNGVTTKPHRPPEGRARVYLTCDAGHTHPYVVHRPAPEKPKRYGWMSIRQMREQFFSR